MSGNIYNAATIASDTYATHVDKLRRRYTTRIRIINPTIGVANRDQFEEQLNTYLGLHMAGQWEHQRTIYHRDRDHYIWFMLAEDALVATLAWSGKVV